MIPRICRLPQHSLVLLALLIPAVAFAQISVEDAWVRGTVQDQRTTGAFMRLTSSSDTSLVGVASPIAGFVEIHESSMHGGVMRMRAVTRVPLAANKPIELKPGGYHVMLMSLKQPVNVGETVPITLTFEDKTGKRTTLDVRATVRALSTAPAKHAH
jgi:periplasmic copper chaperone A